MLVMKRSIFFLMMLAMATTWFSCDDDDGGPAVSTEISLFQITSPVAAVGIIDETTQTITINVPFGTDITNMTGSATIPEGAMLTPDISAGVDFSGGPVDFILTNEGETATYTATVVVGENPLRIALVGTAESIDDIENPEIKEAYEWAVGEYGNRAGYISFGKLTTESISTALVVWFHYDSSPREIPESALDVKDVLAEFYKAGGNVLLTTHASGYMVDLGRISADYGPTGGGDGPDAFENPDNWGISYTNEDYVDGNADHPLFEGLNTTEVTFEGMTYPAIFLLDGGLKRDHSHLWDFNQIPAIVDMVPDPAEPNARKEAFESATGSAVRASFEWDPAANGVELATVIEFEPTAEFEGTGITISLGAYEWYQSDERTNMWRDNITGLTKNALSYLGVE